MKYYVYVLFRGNGSPFYVGMGTGNRWLSHEQRASRYRSRKSNVILRTIQELGEVPKVKVADNLTKQRAFAIEVALIAAIGRYPDGPLVNLTNGGDGVPGLDQAAKARIGQAASIFHSSKSRSVEVRNKIAASLTGRSLSDEHKNKLKIARRKRVVTAETKTKMKLTMHEKASDPTYRANLSLSARGLSW